MTPTPTSGRGAAAASGLAFVFPGQGSQRVGMLSALAAAHPSLLGAFAQASGILGYDLWELAQNGPEADLARTERTQPLLLTASVALWRLWRRRGGPLPAFMAGHSLGEISALVCASALAFDDALPLVEARGRFMQQAVPEGVGAMAAILGMPDDATQALCESSAEDGETVEIANFNSPGQVVIAGHAAAVSRAADTARRAGARATPLPVSAPFHTGMMRPAAERLRERLDGVALRAPEVPVVHNVGAAEATDPERVKALLVAQVASPVPWVDCVRRIASAGVSRFAECGAGRVLSGLNRRIDRSLSSFSLERPDEFDRLLEAVSA